MDVHIGWTEKALAQHLADEDRARRRLAEQGKHHRGDHHRTKIKHNRAAADRAWKREVKI